MPTYDVIVRKDFPLAKGESVRAATKQLRETAQAFMSQKLNATKLDVFPVEVFSSAVILDVFKIGGNEPPKLYAVKFSRDNNGAFVFGEMMEVERVVGFQPKAGASVLKADALPEAPGWKATSKSFWGGVV